MKKLLLIICLVFTIIMLQNNLGFEARYDLILENPPIGYSPSGDPVIVAQGILKPNQCHRIGEFKDCPDPVFKIIWTINDRIVKYRVPDISHMCDLVVLRPLAFTLFGNAELLDDET